jgi:hypothetical protein
MGYHQTELHFGVAFEEPSEQSWTFGSGDVIETMQKVLLLEHGVDEETVNALEYDDLTVRLRDELGLEIPWVNNPTPLGHRFILLTSRSVSVDEGGGKTIDHSHFSLGMEEVLRLEWAVKTLELKASAPTWMLQSAYC